MVESPNHRSPRVTRGLRMIGPVLSRSVVQHLHLFSWLCSSHDALRLRCAGAYGHVIAWYRRSRGRTNCWRNSSGKGQSSVRPSSAQSIPAALTAALAACRECVHLGRVAVKSFGTMTGICFIFTHLSHALVRSFGNTTGL